MKTVAESLVGITESGINCRLNHKSFLEHARKTNRFHFKKLLRRVDKKEQKLIAALGLEDFPLHSKVHIHPEFIVFTQNLYGLARKLLVYLIFYEINHKTCRFTADEEMMKRFHRFCFLLGEELDGHTNIRQALTTLKRKNTLTPVDGDSYMLNPLIAGGSSERKRRKLIDAYSHHLEQNGFDSSIHFYPVYSFNF